MKFFLLLTLLVTAGAIIQSCNIINDMVCENGKCRQMTADEKNQMVAYGKKWEQWGKDFSLYMRGQGKKPTTPVMPCLCSKCDL